MGGTHSTAPTTPTFTYHAVDFCGLILPMATVPEEHRANLTSELPPERQVTRFTQVFRKNEGRQEVPEPHLFVGWVQNGKYSETNAHEFMVVDARTQAGTLAGNTRGPLVAHDFCEEDIEAIQEDLEALGVQTPAEELGLCTVRLLSVLPR